MLALLIGSCLGLAACTPGNSDAQTPAPRMPSKDSTMKIRLIVGEQVATATLYDNATARDFASLPLTLTMEDYDTIERVSSCRASCPRRARPKAWRPQPAN
jgi:hypothetical protein